MESFTIFHPTQALVHEHIKGIRTATLKEVDYYISQVQQIRIDALGCSAECDVLESQLNEIKQQIK